MAKFYTPINSFAEVERMYNNITPVVKRDVKCRKLARNLDLRPTNCRDRQWERIIKINANKYVLSDSDCSYLYGFFGDQRYNYSVEEYNNRIEANAPITWERKRNGDATLTIRNGKQLSKYISSHIGRYDFLNRHLPRSWHMYCFRSNQYVLTGVGKFVLPHNTFMDKKLCHHQHIPSYANPELQAVHDERLIFTRKADGTWLPPKRTYKQLLPRVNKRAKAAITKTTKPFFADVWPLISMLKQSGVDRNDEDMQKFSDWVREEVTNEVSCDYPLFGGHASLSIILLDRVYNEILPEGIKPLRAKLLEVMKDPDHEHRISLVKAVTYYILKKELGSRTYMVDLRPAINSWINSVFGLRNKQEVEL